MQSHFGQLIDSLTEVLPTFEAAAHLCPKLNFTFQQHEHPESAKILQRVTESTLRISASFS